MDNLRKCSNCGIAEDDTFPLNQEGLCEECAENEEYCKILDEDETKEMDFNSSMNG